MSEQGFPRYASIKVVDGPVTSFLLAERVPGGWQAGVMHYPDAMVERFTPMTVFPTPTEDLGRPNEFDSGIPGARYL